MRTKHLSAHAKIAVVMKAMFTASSSGPRFGTPIVSGNVHAIAAMQQETQKRNEFKRCLQVGRTFNTSRLSTEVDL